jgi:dCMP deaminase
MLNPQGICAGKHAVAEYLIQHQGFRLLELKNSGVSHTASDPRLQHTNLTINQDSRLEFDTAESLLEFATKRWQEHWITTHIWNVATLDRFLQRPFFLLVSVDAPVSLRWKRFAER